MVRLRLALILLDLFFPAFEIENTDDGTDNLGDNDFTISGTDRDTSIVDNKDLSNNMKKRKYHSLYSNSVMLE